MDRTHGVYNKTNKWINQYLSYILSRTSRSTVIDNPALLVEVDPDPEKGETEAENRRDGKLLGKEPCAADRGEDVGRGPGVLLDDVVEVLEHGGHHQAAGRVASEGERVQLQENGGGGWKCKDI